MTGCSCKGTHGHFRDSFRDGICTSFKISRECVGVGRTGGVNGRNRKRKKVLSHGFYEVRCEKRADIIVYAAA